MKHLLAGMLLTLLAVAFAQQGRTGSPLLGAEWPRPADPLLPEMEDVWTDYMQRFAGMVRAVYGVSCAGQEIYSWVEPTAAGQSRLLWQVTGAITSAGWTMAEGVDNSIYYYGPSASESYTVAFTQGGHLALINYAFYPYQGVLLDICLVR